MAINIRGNLPGVSSGAGDPSGCEPVYESMAGWTEDIIGLANYEDLPEAARAYIEYIEKAGGVPVKIIGTGPEREQVIIR